MKSSIFKFVYTQTLPSKTVDALAVHTGLSKMLIKRLMNSGAVWYKKKGSGKVIRQRKASHQLSVGDQIEIYYDPDILNLKLPNPECILDQTQWGIWYKPSGMLAQGTKYGDENSLIRKIEKQKKQAFLIHRIDREAFGLVIIAYTPKAAALLSELLKNHQIQKHYLIKVKGDIREDMGNQGTIDIPLDQKTATTKFWFLSESKGNSIVKVELVTGRTHQIRRHFELSKHPVLGDPRYGKNNKNQEGLMLAAVSLAFKDPFTKKPISCTLPASLKPWFFEEQLD